MPNRPSSAPEACDVKPKTLKADLDNGLDAIEKVDRFEEKVAKDLDQLIDKYKSCRAELPADKKEAYAKRLGAAKMQLDLLKTPHAFQAHLEELDVDGLRILQQEGYMPAQYMFVLDSKPVNKLFGVRPGNEAQKVQLIAAEMLTALGRDFKTPSFLSERAPGYENLPYALQAGTPDALARMEALGIKINADGNFDMPEQITRFNPDSVLTMQLYAPEGADDKLIVKVIQKDYQTQKYMLDKSGYVMSL